MTHQTSQGSALAPPICRAFGGGLAIVLLSACQQRPQQPATDTSKRVVTASASDLVFDTLPLGMPNGVRVPHLRGGGQRGRADDPSGASLVECDPDAGKTPGIPGQLEEHLDATWAYIGRLCFMEDPGSERKLRGGRGVLMWILPESRVDSLTNADLGIEGRVVAKIWNYDPHGKDFPEWGHLTRHGGPAYLWVGPDKDHTIISRVFKYGPGGTIDDLIDYGPNHLKHGTYSYHPASYPQHSFAEARWEHPDNTQSKESIAKVGRLFVDDGKSAWFNCDTGCCTMGDLW